MGLTTTELSCSSCGTQLSPDSKFCNQCGVSVAQATRAAEYKQVTVLFADVVHSMDIAKAVGAERLREIMAGLLDRATAVVGRYGGTVDKFTGDGVMAIFGAPLALEDHALRACRAALDIHTAISDLADEVRQRDGLELQLRIGLNSGQVIAGDIGSAGAGYTAIGEQVGMAQRMESVAPPSGVMLSASTARLVEAIAALGGAELVHIKGAEHPVVARKLLGVSEPDRTGAGAVSALVGRRWEMAAVEGLLDRAMEGHGAVVTVVGSPGIGKSRLVREVTALAAARDVEVFSTYCESHTTQVSFHAVARLLRAATGVGGLDGATARAQIRAENLDADREDLLLFDDLLGIADPDVELPQIDPDARRRRLTALVNTASLARESPAVYVIEDAHWIDEVSESMLADFVTVMPQTPSLVLVTYRPEYRGALSQVQGAQTISLAPLSDPETATLVDELVGQHPSVTGLAPLIVERASGNPFFAHEIVRDLAEQGVLEGQAGHYTSTADAAEVSMPATVQATIAARIDRLDPAAKRSLCAAAVIGANVSRDLLESLGIDPAVEDLVRGQFLDQISFTTRPEFMFHHPLIRTVAYESQLKSDRAALHRRLAAAIESRDPASADENAALIAEHLESAGDLNAAYGWHMRAGAWGTNRDINAARLSWERAQRIADELPVEDSDRTEMRIAPRTMLCGTAWRVHEHVVATRFHEHRELCAAAGDKASLAVGLVGQVMDHLWQDRMHPASDLASEAWELIESIGDANLTVGLANPLIYAKSDNAEWSSTLQWSQAVIDLADGDSSKGDFISGSPLTLAFTTRAVGRFCLGHGGWRDDTHHGLVMARNADPMSQAFAVAWAYFPTISNGVLNPTDSALQEIESALRTAERSSDDLAVTFVRNTLAVALVNRQSTAERDRGGQLLSEVRSVLLSQGYLLSELPLVNVYLAREVHRCGSRDQAIPLMRTVLDHVFREDRLLSWCIPTTGVFVEALLDRDSDSDRSEAEAAINRLADAPAEPGLAIRAVWVLKLRTLLAHARGDDDTYRDCRDRYRKMATNLGFEGHMQWAEEMA